MSNGNKYANNIENSDAILLCERLLIVVGCFAHMILDYPSCV
jgi:hypothetical protein